jgi:predicted ester cyclase
MTGQEDRAMSHSAQTDVGVSIEGNKIVVRRLFEEAFNGGELPVVDELWIPSELESGKHSITALRSAFPDYRRTIEAQLSEGDLVATRWIARGTHRGPYQSRILGRTLAPTERSFEVPGMSVHRIAGGRIVQAWVLGNDSAELLSQLNALPCSEVTASH